jgi:hypothetical protein
VMMNVAIIAIDTISRRVPSDGNHDGASHIGPMSIISFPK